MNDEDIKTLEESIQEAYRCYDYDLDYMPFSKGIAEITEHLIKTNKELEKTITRKMNNNKKLAHKYLQERYKNRQLKLDEKEQEIIEAYRNMKNITGSDEWIVCNPATMWSEYFIPVSKIKENIELMQESIVNEDYSDNTNLVNCSVSDTNIVISYLLKFLEGK